MKKTALILIMSACSSLASAGTYEKGVTADDKPKDERAAVAVPEGAQVVPHSDYKSDKSAFERIVKQNQGRFASEVKDESLFDREFLLRIPVRDLNSMTKPEDFLVSDVQYVEFQYDDVKQEASFLPGFLSDRSFIATDKCKNIGKGVGRTALGAKVAYTVRSCEGITFVGGKESQPDRTDCKASEFPGYGLSCKPVRVQFTATPAEFRMLTKKGLEAEFRVKFRRNTDGPFVEYKNDYRGPALDFPWEYKGRSWKVSGTILQVTFFRDGKPLPIQ